MGKLGGASIILASGSPRRRELLKGAGYEFQVVPSGVDESSFSTVGVMPGQYAQRLALAKAKSVAVQYPEHLVIGADTIAYFDGQIVGKPADAKQAEEITKELFSGPHKVITAVAIVRLSDSTELVDSDTTLVYPRHLTDEQIRSHIKSGTWRGKAGAYAIQETNDEFVERIEGSLTNVMGLPMELLKNMLAKLPQADDLRSTADRD